MAARAHGVFTGAEPSRRGEETKGEEKRPVPTKDGNSCVYFAGGRGGVVRVLAGGGQLAPTLQSALRTRKGKFRHLPSLSSFLVPSSCL